MLQDWFPHDSSLLGLCQPHHRVTWFVVGAWLASTVAAYTAFDMVGRARLTAGRDERGLWLATAGLSMGLGIWVMNFISMLVIEVPVLSHVDLPFTALSGAVSVISCTAAFLIMSDDQGNRIRLLAAGLVMGGGAGLMHYTGMAALRIDAHVYYEPLLFTFSLVVPVVLSVTGLLALSTVPLFGEEHPILARLAGASVMGLAIVLMHETGMFATYFCQNLGTPATDRLFDPTVRTAAIAMGSVLLIGLALIAALFGKKAAPDEGILRDAFDGLAGQMAVFDAEGRFVLANDAWRRSCRARPELLVPGTKLEDILRDEFRRGTYASTGEDEDAWVNRQVRVHLDKNRSFEQRLGDGSWILTENRAIENGAIASLRTDISDMKAAQEELRRDEERLDEDIGALKAARAAQRDREQRLERAQEVMGIGTWEVDVRSERAVWSREMYKIRDVEPSSDNGQTHDPRENIDEEDVAAFNEWLSGLQLGLSPEPLEYRIIRPDGDERVVSASGEVIIDQFGAIVKIVGTECDITARRDLEQQLVQARRMQTVGRLAGGLAQDFANRLGTIIGNLDMASDQLQPDSPVAKFSRAALDSALDAADMLQNLLTLSQGRQRELGPVSVDEAFANVMPLARRALGPRIHLSENVEPELWTEAGDADQLEVAILDLIAYARGTVPQGGTMTIEASGKSLSHAFQAASGEIPAGDFVTISVSGGEGTSPAPNLTPDAPSVTRAPDETVVAAEELIVEPSHGRTGPEPVPEHLSQPEIPRDAEPEPAKEIPDHLYGPMPIDDEADPATAMVTAAVSIDPGLNLAVETAKNAGGVLDTHGDGGDSRSVSLYLPSAGFKSGVKRGADRQKRHILMVEDNPEMGSLGAGILRDLGFQVTLARRGEEAAEFLSDGTQYDLLFADLAMQGQWNSMALAKAIRTLNPESRILFTSGFSGGATSRIQSKKFGADFIAKPWRKADLVQLVRAILHNVPEPAASRRVHVGVVIPPVEAANRGKTAQRVKSRRGKRLTTLTPRL